MAKAMQTAKLFQEAVHRITTNKNGYDKWFRESVKFISGGDGGCIAEMTVGDQHVNVQGTLHGGCTATLVDVVTAVALNASPLQPAGASIEINVSYLKAAKLGDVIVMEAKPQRVGKNLAFLSLSITNKADGSLIATGKHITFIGRTTVIATDKKPL